MNSGHNIPRVAADTVLSDALLEISDKGLGMTTVLDSDGALAGVFTDGDLRRALDHRIDINATTIGEIMSRSAKRASREMLAAEAMRIMEENEISSLVVLNESGELEGVVHLKDLLHAGIA
ncbi:MAG: CBS domain-containing protein [Halioglobus sp.]|nr:CBS domain-containing protein [Halioglobus sp.]